MAVVIAAAICLAAPVFLTSSLFNSPFLLWLGLATEAPPSNDYNPMLPAASAWRCRHRRRTNRAGPPPRSGLGVQLRNALERGVAFIGRHSLACCISRC